MERIIGIDPGLNGGVVEISSAGAVISKWSMPKVDNVIDPLALYNTLAELTKNQNVLVILEKVHSMPGQGVSSSFKFGRLYGMTEAFIVSTGAPYELVTPQKWQKEMHSGIEKSLKPKDRSLLAVRRLFPKENLMATERSRTPHDGIVDALLIAEYGRRKSWNTDLTKNKQ